MSGPDLFTRNLGKPGMRGIFRLAEQAARRPESFGHHYAIARNFLILLLVLGIKE